METGISLKAYLDESGNSGKNLIDINQPFFTIGCVLFNDSKLDKVKNFIDKIPSSHKDEKGEIKGNNIACYDQTLALKILSEFIPETAETFFFSVLEKKFMIAGQIVENFFDYAYNDKTDVSWTYKSDSKISLANFFYDTLSEQTLESVHGAFISPNEALIRKCFNEIINEIDGKDYEFDVKSILLGADEHLESLSESLSRVNAKNAMTRGVPKNTINTPNITTFYELIGRIEKYLTCIEQKAILVFDNSEQFNKAFYELIRGMINAPRKKFAISENEFFYMGFRHLIEFEVKESNKAIGLQMADFLTSIVNHFFTKILVKQDDQLTNEDVLLTSVIFFLSTQSPCGYWVISKAKSQRIGKILKSLERLK